MLTFSKGFDVYRMVFRSQNVLFTASVKNPGSTFTHGKPTSISIETLQTSAINAIKAIRSFKKREDELTGYKFLEEDFQLITDTNINNTLKMLSKIGRTENKPSKVVSLLIII